MGEWVHRAGTHTPVKDLPCFRKVNAAITKLPRASELIPIGKQKAEHHTKMDTTTAVVLLQ